MQPTRFVPHLSMRLHSRGLVLSTGRLIVAVASTFVMAITGIGWAGYHTAVGRIIISHALPNASTSFGDDQNILLMGNLLGWEGPFQGADNAPFEIQVPASVIALEVVGDLSTLHRGAHDLPALFSVGVRPTVRLVYYSLQRLIRVVDEGALPPLRVPLAV
jgi:hypothetical protein